MFIAEELRRNNISEYLLYMWQVEDLIRANGYDADILFDKVIKGCGRSVSEQKSWKDWYENLIEMMVSENKKERGHLQINENVLVMLTDLHTNLLNSKKIEEYRESYYKALPFIVEFRAKSGNVNNEELRDCFEFMYGVWMLRLQKKKISDSTEYAVKSISSFLSLLSVMYDRDKKGVLKLDMED
jgi:hypothetical protein